MKKTLTELAVIKAGHPFRGKIEEIKDGNVYAIQIRDLDDFGHIKDWMKVVRTEIAGRKLPDWLEPGDVLFAARGQRNFAVCVNDAPSRTVCGPHFFQIHVRDKHQLLPEFLTWVLNQKPAQRYFEQSAEGSAQLSIRKAVLENIQITIPCLATQQSVVALDQATIREKRILKALIENRDKEMQFIAQEILG